MTLEDFIELNCRETLEIARHNKGYVLNELISAFKSFAIEHTSIVLTRASEKATISSVEYSKFGGKIIKTEDLGQEIPTENPQVYLSVNVDSILNCYPLTDIK